MDLFLTLLISSALALLRLFIPETHCLATLLRLGRGRFRAPKRRGLQIDTYSVYTKHMKKITIVTAVAAVLTLAPLMVGCGGETETVNPDDDEAQQPVPGEDGGEPDGTSEK